MDEDAVEALYGAPLEDFVAERTRIAKALRADGDRDAAAAVTKLPKPSAPAWALNHVARAEPEAVAVWLDAAAELREASARPAEVGGDAIRAASAAHRAATSKLVRLVRERAQPAGKPLSEPMADRVRALLHAATSDAALAEELRAGRLTGERAAPRASAGGAAAAGAAPGAAEAAGDAPDAGAAATDGDRDAPDGDAAAAGKRGAADERAAADERGTAADERAADDERAAAAAAERRAELERRERESRAEARRLRDEASDLSERAATAAARLEDARRALHRAESEASAAHGAAADAAETAAAARAEHDRLRRLLDDTA